MKINNLKVNGFGKLKNKEIELKEGINIIYGKNEAGKSTLLKFITSMLFGLTKNKNGGNVPEIEKYKPWNNEEFSGKISYELDNIEQYEVYRDFNKKNPKIFNHNLEDISKKFNIDKTKGIQFFLQQVGIDEEMFTSSVITKQAEVKLDNKTQNVLLQKISNILGTGEDTASYTSIVNKLRKKINDEIGTNNTKEKPINIIDERLNTLNKEKEELSNYQMVKFDIEEEINQIENKIEEEEQNLDILRKANLKKESLKELESKIKANININNNIENEIEKLSKKYNYKPNNNKNIIPAIILSAILTLATISMVVVKKLIIKISILFISLLPIIYLILKVVKNINIKKEKSKEQNNIDSQIKILEKNKLSQNKEIEQLKQNYNNDLNNIKKEFNILNFDDLLLEIEDIQKTINDLKIKLHTLRIDRDNIMPRLERLVNIEEELENLKEEKAFLENKKEDITRTLEYLEIAYNKMKEQITPKFTLELSRAMNNISNGTYKNVRINTNGEIIVEDANGEYINAENLSIGTIDQIYLSLRLATIKEISQETMPIILDETFAYYDNNRLENILRYISTEHKNRQVIIFTCTNREKDILKSLNIQFNEIVL